LKQAIVLLINGSFPNGQSPEFAKDNVIRSLEQRNISAVGLTLALDNPNAVMYALGRIAWFSRDILDPKALNGKEFSAEAGMRSDEEMGFKLWWKKEGMPSLKKFAKDVWKGTDAR